MGGDSPTNVLHNLSYYLKCCVGGILSCGITHTAICPVDVVKCRKQVNHKFARSTILGLKKTWKAGEFTLGWLPTLIGYSAQGLGKFGFYEIFKDKYSDLVGPEKALKYRNGKLLRSYLTCSSRVPL